MSGAEDRYVRADEIMTRSPVVLRDDDTIQAAGKVLVQRKISGVLVVSAEGLLRGIVTERDLLLQHSLVVGIADVMSRDLITAGPDVTVDELASLMFENSVKRIPIVQDGRPIGIVSRRDILRSKLGYPSPAARSSASA